MNNKLYIGVGAGIVLILVAGVTWFLFLRPASPTNPSEAGFGIGSNRSVTVTTEGTENNQATEVGQQVSTKVVFKIADGPIAGATLVETTRPTTTLARYVKQENGHVFDLPLDVPGAIPRAISNTTIPGVIRAVWAQGGDAALLQYVSDGALKTVYLGFPVATSSATSTRPVKIQFLPDNILELAASPNGKNISYLLRATGGVDGYTANADGSGSKKLFSLPLSQVVLSWPAQTTLLVTTKSAAGVPGVAFSINTASGAVSPLIYAQGLTATADRSFSRVVYQAALSGAAAPSTYSRTVSSGSDIALSFDPYPEKCIWSARATSTMYCAAPLEYVPDNYLDLWHLGLASVPESIFSFDISAGQTSVIAIPGSGDGGAQSDILEMALSPSESYLSFIAKSGRVLWGTRLK